MSDLKYWQDKIKEKRKKTEFRDFLKEVGAWYPLVFHKYGNIVSRYPDTERIGGLLSSKDFEEEREGYRKNGIDFDHSKSFFDNFRELFSKTKVGATLSFPELNTNAEYGDVIYGAKNSYLNIGAIDGVEDIAYNFYVIDNCKNVFSSLVVAHHSNNVYFSKCVDNSSNIFYSKYILNGYENWFSTNLIGCKNCIFCNDLENKSYHIENKEYSKEEYERRKGEILKHKKDFLDYYLGLDKIGKSLNSERCTGNYNLFCQDLENGFINNYIKDGRNVIMSDGKPTFSENFYDVLSTSPGGNKDFYGVMGAGYMSHNVYCSSEITDGSFNIFYSYYLRKCSYCIGCIGLKNASYCIFNKQYSKEEWEDLADKIFSQMEKDGILGDFFPGSVTPYYFNDTMASFLGNFKKDDIVADGYLWRDESIRTGISDLTDVTDFSSLDIENFDTSICKKIIKSESGNYYKIIPMEYDFLKKYGLPLPDKDWTERIRIHLVH